MNRNIWNLYKNSERGQNAIEIFNFNEHDDLFDKTSKIYDFCSEFMGDISEKEDFINTLFSVYENVSVSQLSLKENEKINSFFERFIDNFEISVIEENESGELFKVLRRNHL